MRHEELNSVPNYETAFFEGSPVSPKPGYCLWSNAEPPPAIGSEINLKMNNLGRAVVIGYVVKGPWLALKTKVLNPPKCLMGRGSEPLIEIAFGAEFNSV